MWAMDSFGASKEGDYKGYIGINIECIRSPHSTDVMINLNGGTGCQRRYG